MNTSKYYLIFDGKLSVNCEANLGQFVQDQIILFPQSLLLLSHFVSQDEFFSLQTQESNFGQ